MILIDLTGHPGGIHQSQTLSCVRRNVTFRMNQIRIRLSFIRDGNIDPSVRRAPRTIGQITKIGRAGHGFALFIVVEQGLSGKKGNQNDDKDRPAEQEYPKIVIPSLKAFDRILIHRIVPWTWKFGFSGRSCRCLVDTYHEIRRDLTYRSCVSTFRRSGRIRRLGSPAFEPGKNNVQQTSAFFRFTLDFPGINERNTVVDHLFHRDFGCEFTVVITFIAIIRIKCSVRFHPHVDDREFRSATLTKKCDVCHVFSLQYRLRVRKTTALNTQADLKFSAPERSMRCNLPPRPVRKKTGIFSSLTVYIFFFERTNSIRGDNREMNLFDQTSETLGKKRPRSLSRDLFFTLQQ